MGEAIARACTRKLRRRLPPATAAAPAITVTASAAGWLRLLVPPTHQTPLLGAPSPRAWIVAVTLVLLFAAPLYGLVRGWWAHLEALRVQCHCEHTDPTR